MAVASEVEFIAEATPEAGIQGKGDMDTTVKDELGGSYTPASIGPRQKGPKIESALAGWDPLLGEHGARHRREHLRRAFEGNPCKSSACMYCHPLSKNWEAKARFKNADQIV